METCFNYTEKEHGYFSSDERKYITKIHKLAEKYPEQVRIIAEPENNDGCIYCELPTSWLKIIPKREVSDEQREISRVRMMKMHEHNQNTVSDTQK